MGIYLDSLRCRTIVHERHYIDRHFIDDFSLFYSRSLRDYPNSCQRLHFFSSEFDEEQWSGLVERANGGEREEVERELAREYLGFMVIKPLPGSPIGRTVLRTFERDAPRGGRREFTAIRGYTVSLAGLSLSVRGLAFQQQDQGVSACATTALWSALQRTAPLEHLCSPTPAEITEAASRYMLVGGELYRLKASTSINCVKRFGRLVSHPSCSPRHRLAKTEPIWRRTFDQACLCCSESYQRGRRSSRRVFGRSSLGSGPASNGSQHLLSRRLDGS